MDPIDLWRAADALLKLFTPTEVMERARTRTNKLSPYDDPGIFVRPRIELVILDLATAKPSAVRH